MNNKMHGNIIHSYINSFIHQFIQVKVDLNGLEICFMKEIMWMMLNMGKGYFNGGMVLDLQENGLMVNNRDMDHTLTNKGH